MSYIFISDYAGQMIGGAEFVDETLKDFLSGSTSMRCSDCTVDKLSKLINNRIIVSNFTALSEECKSYLSNKAEYIIWEHDHKYLKTRNPSVFKDFIAPPDQIINLEFYRKAKAVVCQTQQHLDVIKKNTSLRNLVNFGGSIWSNEQLDFIENIYNKRIEGHKVQYGILNSDIVHKGTRQSVSYCEKNNLLYNLIEIKDWEDFIKDLSSFYGLVFFPQVLETCSRISVEARMLGLKVIGSGNISAIKEDWFKQYSGKELINYFREKNKNIKKFVEDCFSFNQEKKEKKVANITVILNLYKRPQNLEKQIEAFRNQTVKPKEIWVWQNFPNKDEIFRESLSLPEIDKWITSNHNWGVFGRFTMAQLVQTEFVCINDDDTIPGPEWLETCLDSYEQNKGLQGGIGVRLLSDDYANHYRIGWAEPNRQPEEVDLVGHSWFFPKKYLKYMWQEEPFTWNMEDAHFSYCLQKYGNIKTYVPAQFEKEKSSSILGYQLGIDENAMSNPKNHQKFYTERNNAIKHYLNNGWKKVLK